MDPLLAEQVKKAKDKEAELRALKGEATPEDLASYEQEFGAIPGQQQALSDQQTEKEGRKDWAELADVIAQNLAKIGAAKQGLKSGADLSQLDIKGYDWSKARDRDLSRYKTEKDTLGEREKSLAGLIALGAKKPKEDKTRLIDVQHMVDERGHNVYRIEGQPGYYDENWNPVEGVKYKKEPPAPKEPSPFLGIAKENQLTRAQQDYEKNISKETTTAGAIDEVKQILAEALTNPAAYQGLGAKMPRVMGEVGNLTKDEQERYSAGSASVQDRVNQTIEKLSSGTIEPKNQKFLMDLINTMEKANKARIEAKTNKFVGGRSKILKLEPEELKGYLGLDSAAPQQPGAPSTADAPGSSAAKPKAWNQYKQEKQGK
jgi:hypothetical protein